MNSALSGKMIFLSASVPRPERASEYQTDSPPAEAVYRRIPDAQFEIEQAVVSLARAVFAAGGRLVFGGHPSISPLVATVAGEYRFRSDAGAEQGPESPVLIYQSEVFRDHAPEATLLMFELGLARVRWTPAVDGERFDRDAARTGPVCPRSLAVMRATMLEESRPDAMICIGGMAGVLEEVDLFTRSFPASPVFVLESTGGAAMRLARTMPRVRVLDREIMARVIERRLAAGAAPEPVGERDKGREQEAVVPYPLIMQTLVGEIAGAD
jgi:hypothetical protein